MCIRILSLCSNGNFFVKCRTRVEFTVKCLFAIFVV